MAKITETFDYKDTVRRICVTETTNEQTFQRAPQPEPLAKFVELPVSKLVEQLDEAISQLKELDAEILQTQQRGKEIKAQIGAIEKALANAQVAKKETVAAFARGKATQEAIKLAQSSVLNLTNQLHGMSAAQDVITTDLAEMTPAWDAQKKRVERLDARVWAAIELAELERVKPVLERALTAGIQARSSFSTTFIENLSSLMSHPSKNEEARERAATIAAEYGVTKL